MMQTKPPMDVQQMIEPYKIDERMYMPYIMFGFLF